MRVISPHSSNGSAAVAKTPTIGKYRIIETIGRGAMGIVYKARDPEIGRDVAIKLLRSFDSAHPQDAADAFKRFRLEARSAGNLRHPNIITIFEANQEGSTPYIVMEYVQGEGLDQILARERRLSPARTVEILRQIAAGLDHAHRVGVVHRDIKPSNILIDSSNRVFILDFGVASMTKRVAGATPLPDHDPEIIVGTPAYMSPEQIKNESLDGRTDVFSLAALAFECLTGKIPFQGETATGLMRNIVAGKRRPLGSVAPELPIELEFEFDKAFALDREHRFMTAGALVEALAQALGMAHQETTAPRAEDAPISLSGKTSEGRKRQPSLSEATRLRERIDTSKTRSMWREGSQRAVANDDIFAPRQSSSNHTPKPGALFEGGTPPVIRKTSSGAPQRKAPLSRYRREAIILFVVGCVVAPLTFLSALLVVRGGEADAASVDVSTAPSVTVARPIELESELILPRTEDAAATIPVPQLNNRQVIGILIRGSDNESRILDALTTAVERRIPEFVDAGPFPLKNRSTAVRRSAAKLLGESGDRRIVPNLVLVLEDADAGVRTEGARALAALGDRRALGFLSAQYLAESDPSVKSSLKRSIEQLSGLPFNEANLMAEIERRAH